MFYFTTILIILLILIIVALLVGLIKGAPYMPTPKNIIREMLRLADVKPGEVVYDLGSGDGRIIITAAREFGARAIGIEVSMLYYFWSKCRIWLLGLTDQAAVKKGDIFRVDFSEADIVTLFLLQKTNVRLLSILNKKLKPGTRVISRYFTFPGLRPIKVNKQHKLYLYKF